MALTQVRSEQIKGVSGFPKPFFSEINPFFMALSTSATVTITGSFFTPETTFSIGGCTVNSKVFKSSNEVELNITSGATEGDYNITINNGQQTVISNAFTLTQGQVFIPDAVDWANASNISLSDNGEVLQSSYGVTGKADWTAKTFEVLKDWELKVKFNYDPNNPYPGGNNFNAFNSHLRKVSDGSVVISFYYYVASNNSSGGFYTKTSTAETAQSAKAIGGSTDLIMNENVVQLFSPRMVWNGGVLSLYDGTSLVKNFTFAIPEDVYLDIGVQTYGYKGIKFIELP